ncbi:fused MFS/spermidine synthase [Pontixanthobacter aestiaquae]|uniref:Spermidine synthase n=1 Tax=Pontixanthobacter aestiaquae TaxID=1509367 RepID=A0A844Z316_9SPHN|nr:fused MFS/spermidine synthase [Pontixanthobacter aestiaquae]MDN3646920.1 fused MFS/spermidine synthase [Pontixanthobacter aestiaquae]MXO82098.1 hypothetical protein [Pontixanthobacter aestiaquae]
MTQTRRWLFVATILTGSFLLFLVQPLVARMALPRLGGASAVWNSAMLVYQALLLGGYAYAHALSRFTIARQASIHIALLVLAGLTLPIALADLPPPSAGMEIVWVPLLFLVTIGPVFFVVSAQAPLIQRWYAANEGAGDPYWLYAASNIGSFSGLLAYPLLLEPNYAVADQSTVWTIGYCLLLALVVFAAASRWNVADISVNDGDSDLAEPIGAARMCLWLALAAVPSGLMLSTTTHLTTDIVAMPLLWVIPLGLYLLSFVFAFNENSTIGWVLAKVAPVTVILLGSLAMVSGSSGGLNAALASVGLLFVAAVALHRRLYQDRPGVERLTFFYLVMSAGGVLGGAFTALLAPALFDWVWEHPLLVLAAAALLPNTPLIDWMKWLDFSESSKRIATLAIVLGAVLLASLLDYFVANESTLGLYAMVLAVTLCGVLVLGNRWAMVAILLVLMVARGGYETLATSLKGDRDRSYFGIYTVTDDPVTERRHLIHGTTVHGAQNTNPAQQFDPTTYYGKTSGVGLALAAAPGLIGSEASIGVVGLGVGTLACYQQPGQSWEFFEIDPKVVEYSRDGSFSFISECTPDSKMHIGDARVMLERMENGRFDILVVDAFSSDSIPVHLMTSEAFGLYRRMVGPDGVVMVHISNRFMDLQQVIAALADEQGLTTRVRIDGADKDSGITSSMWVALSANPTKVEELARSGKDAGWQELPQRVDTVWTDDFASILPFIQWENVLGN